MDPSMDLPTTNEPPFNPALDVNHDPTAPPVPYAEMITAAITALHEREGSSKIAIAKCIDRMYTNLPSNHSFLLTQHLKHLKNTGYLAMVKHSYMLAGPPGSAPPPPSAVDSNGSDASPLVKRKPGRPPKSKPEAQSEIQPPAQFQDQLQSEFQAQFQAQQVQFPQFQAQQPQFFQQQHQYEPQPQYHHPQMQFQPDPSLQPQPQAQFQPQPQPQAYASTEAQNYARLGPESVFASLGLTDGPVGAQSPAVSVPPASALEGSSIRRGRGRPRKDLSTPIKPVEPKVVDLSGVKRRPGRPPRSPGSVNATVSPKPRGRPRKGSTPGRRGRPRKSSTPISANGSDFVTSVPASGAPGGPVLTPKRRGRPRKSTHEGTPIPTDVGVTDVPIADAFDSADGGVTNGAPSLGKRRGRPPSRSSSFATTPRKARKLSGKPLGRPKKNVTSPAAASDTKAYGELRGKLEQLQLKVKETANVLKPCLNAETPAIAIAALQELEELAAGELITVQQT